MKVVMKSILRALRDDDMWKVVVVAWLFIVILSLSAVAWGVVPVQQDVAAPSVEQPWVSWQHWFEWHEREVPDIRDDVAMMMDVGPLIYWPDHWDERGIEPPMELNGVGAKSKTYMDYRAITDRSSAQWTLLQELTVCPDGMIRDADGYIAAALGSAFGPIGSRYVFTLDTGEELKVIKADQKQDLHTCPDNVFGLDNWDVIEFIVDSQVMPKFDNGLVYGGNFDNCPAFAGDVVTWRQAE